MEFPQLVQQRRSIKSYDTEKTISDSDLKELFDEVVLSPSSFNLQHWSFIAVKDPVMKKNSGKRRGANLKSKSVR